MFSFFRRNQKESEQCFIQDNPIDTELSYKNFIERVDDQLIGKAIDEKLLILNYLIDSVEIDMCSSAVLEPFISHCRPLLEPFPILFYDNDEVIRVYREKMNVSLSTSHVYVCPWSSKRQVSNILYLNKKDWVFDVSNHKSYYYSDLNLLYVYNGNHSINAGRYFKKGSVLAYEVDMIPLYKDCTTDGKALIYKNNQAISDFSDFRLAVLFTLGKYRWEINHRHIND